MPQAPGDLRQFESLVAIVHALRGPDGCPWDKEQTHQSLTRYALEETAELVEALDHNNGPAICEELGDVLLQVVLHAEIARQTGNFGIHDVVESISRKMVGRHPHVFGDVKVKGSGEVVANWHELKSKEKEKENSQKAKSNADRPLSSGLAPMLPALLASQKIGERTKQHRFDWSRIEDVVAKVEEEMAELKGALKSGDKSEQVAELGDLLFSLAQLARHLGADAEQALRQTNHRFETRFKAMFGLIKKDGADPRTIPLDELEAYWQKAKAEIKAKESTK
jgi:tetrapyrrole methylase family protein / MazG family protein